MPFDLRSLMKGNGMFFLYKYQRSDRGYLGVTV